jgi:hypothetical protein
MFDIDIENEMTELVSMSVGVMKHSIKQNQQFNNVFVKNIKNISEQDLNINSSSNKNIVLNKNIIINTDGNLIIGQSSNITFLDSVNSYDKKLYNYESDLIWGMDVVVTDATLKTEIENVKIDYINVSRINICNNFDDIEEKSYPIIELKAPNEIKDSYSIILPSKKPENNMTLVSRNDGHMEWSYYSSNLPIGIVVEYIGKNIPNGWLECNGQFVSIEKYDKLFNIMDIQETETKTKEGMFQIPNLEGKKILYYGISS